MKKNIIYVLTKTVWLRHLSKIAVAIISCLVILLSNVVITDNLYPVNAQNDLPFYWDFINVDIDLQKNGDMLVSSSGYGGGYGGGGDCGGDGGGGDGGGDGGGGGGD